jgi:hypothetical protein
MIRALVQPAYDSFGVAITIVQQWTEDASPLSILRLRPRDEGGAARFAEWEEHRPCDEVKPTLILDDETARPLLDALTRHYCGAEDTRALRRDYDGERKRVDVLIDHLAAVARTLSEPQP